MALWRGRPLLALLVLAPAPSVGVLVALYLERNLWGVLLWGLSKVWLLGLPVAWHLWIERRQIRIDPPDRNGLLVGLLLGLAAMVGIGVAYASLARFIDATVLRQVVAPLHLTSPIVYLGAALYWIVINSLLEEYVFRWFLTTQAAAVTGRAFAPFVSAAIFTLHHSLAMALYFPAVINICASIGVFVAGAVWGWLYLRYRSIWPGYVSHCLADVAIFILGWRLLFGV